MRNPFLWTTIGLTVLIVGFLGFQAGRGAQPADQSDNPIVALYRTLSPQAQALYFKQSESLSKPVPDRLVALDELTIGCFGPAKVMAMSVSDENLGGQCCGILTDFEAYELQMQALGQFIDENEGSGIIPRDPYDVPVTEAQKLTQMDSDIVLTPEQQAIYDEAIAMSHHGGPCCCKCWKWYVMSGVAKHLIASEGWDAKQIAQMWDLSSSCGHDDDTNMAKHYDAPAGSPTSHE